MKWLTAVLVACAFVLTRPAPAAGCDPDADWCGGGWSWDEPAYEAPAYEPASYAEPVSSWEPSEVEVPVRWYEPVEVPEPVRYEPAVEERVAYEPAAPERPEPASPPAYERDPDPPVMERREMEREDPRPAAADRTAADRAAELGLHAVTDVYAGERVTTAGPTTRFEALTERADPGTFAKLIATAHTGERSDIDARAWNARRTLSDGRPVAGAFYENYVCDRYGCQVDKIVFFQDDEETARLAASPPPAPISAPSDPPAPAPPSGPVTVVAVGAPPSDAWGGGAPALVTPLVERDVLPATIGPGPGAGSGPASGSPPIAQLPPPSAPAQPQRDVRAGLALAPLGDTLGAFEVLRGRRVRLWARATVDGIPARVRSWHVESGDMTVLGPIAGAGDEPLIAAWPAMSPGGVPFRPAIAIDVEVTGAPDRRIVATVDVSVRSPALVQ